MKKAKKPTAEHDSELDAPETLEATQGEEEAGMAGGALVEPLDEAVRRLNDELAHAKDQLLRTAAEFDNFRKRTARERQEIRGRAQADLARGVLDALDDLGRVAHFDPATVSATDVIQGVEMVERKMLKQLEDGGLRRVGNEGDVFDPNEHEAVGTVPADTPERDGTVATVVQAGYKFGEMLLRPARVLVHVAQPAADGNSS